MNALLDYYVMRNVVKPGPLALWLVAPVLLSVVGAGEAEAQIYKYSKPDGSVVYTDSLAELPPDRRAHYNQRQAELEAKARDEEAAMGAEEAERRRLEKERAAIAEAEMAEAERRERLAAMDAALAQYKARKKQSDLDKAGWQRRMKGARDQLARLLAKFRQKQTEWTSLATKASYAMFPGQAEKQEQLAKELKSLELAVDAQIDLVEVRLPEEARKAGVPPGWLR